MPPMLLHPVKDVYDEAIPQQVSVPAPLLEDEVEEEENPAPPAEDEAEQPLMGLFSWAMEGSEPNR